MSLSVNISFGIKIISTSTTKPESCYHIFQNPLVPTPTSVSLVPTPTSVQNLLLSNTHPSPLNHNEIRSFESEIAPTTDVDSPDSPTL